MNPDPVGLAEGIVVHRRTRPKQHSFTYDVSHVWLDPDRPNDVFSHHPAWSANRPAAVRFVRGDYGLTAEGSLNDQACAALTPVLGYRPSGPVRMLSQPRRWGWLFNPITVYFIWDKGQDDPVATVLEVTNTPWKERTWYALALVRDGDWLCTSFEKTLHVSPFLEMDYSYDLGVKSLDGHLDITLDVVPSPAGGAQARGSQPTSPILHTRLRLTRSPASRQTLGHSLRSAGLSTHRVSAGIHGQAARLTAKRVRFRPHPKREPKPPRPEQPHHERDRSDLP